MKETEEIDAFAELPEAAQAEISRLAPEAALGRLAGGLSHEINSPLGAVVNLAGGLSQAFAELAALLPKVARGLPEEERQLFAALLEEAARPRPPLSSRERRARVKALTAELKAWGEADPGFRAQQLVVAGIEPPLERWKRLLGEPENAAFGEAARLAAGIAHNHRTLLSSAEHAKARAEGIKRYLKTFDDEKQILLADGLEHALQLFRNEFKYSYAVDFVKDQFAGQKEKYVSGSLTAFLLHVFEECVAKPTKSGSFKVASLTRGAGAVIKFEGEIDFLPASVVSSLSLEGLRRKLGAEIAAEPNAEGGGFDLKIYWPRT